MQDESLKYVACASVSAVRDSKAKIRIELWDAVREGAHIRVHRIVICDIVAGEIHSDLQPEKYKKIANLIEYDNSVAACNSALCEIAQQMSPSMWLSILSRAEQCGFEAGRDHMRQKFRNLLGIQ